MSVYKSKNLIAHVLFIDFFHFITLQSFSKSLFISQTFIVNPIHHFYKILKEPNDCIILHVNLTSRPYWQCTTCTVLLPLVIDRATQKLKNLTSHITNMANLVAFWNSIQEHRSSTNFSSIYCPWLLDSTCDFHIQNTICIKWCEEQKGVFVATLHKIDSITLYKNSYLQSDNKD